MADIPLVSKLEEYVFLAQRVELQIGATANGDTVADKFTTMREVRLGISHPRKRTNHALGRMYTHGAPDIIISFRLSATQDTVAYLRTRGLRSSAGIIPVYSWAIKFVANDDTAKTIKVKGKLDAKEFIKNDGDQEHPVDVECSLIVTDLNEPAAT